jgi:hypothetical protein
MMTVSLEGLAGGGDPIPSSSAWASTSSSTQQSTDRCSTRGGVSDAGDDRQLEWPSFGAMASARPATGVSTPEARENVIDARRRREYGPG